MITQHEKNKIAEEWLYIAMLYEKELPAHFLNKMIEEIQDLDSHSILKALRVFRCDNKNKTWPRPADIRSLLNPTLSIETKAEQVANSIPLAIKKYGWASPSEARKYMGEVAWRIVETHGGWLDVCSKHGVDLDVGVFHAQARDSAKAIIKASELGQENVAIGYAEKNQFAIDNIDLKKLTSSLQKDI